MYFSFSPFNKNWGPKPDACLKNVTDTDKVPSTLFDLLPGVTFQKYLQVKQSYILEEKA